MSSSCSDRLARTPATLRWLVAAVVIGQADAGDSSSSRAAAVEAGRRLFSNHCSHCHDPNAQSLMPERDLRRLKLRYGENWRQTAIGTIEEGRPSAGMPGWKDLIDDEHVKILITFLETIQRDP